MIVRSALRIACVLSGLLAYGAAMAADAPGQLFSVAPDQLVETPCHAGGRQFVAKNSPPCRRDAESAAGIFGFGFRAPCSRRALHGGGAERRCVRGGVRRGQGRRVEAIA